MKKDASPEFDTITVPEWLRYLPKSERKMYTKTMSIMRKIREKYQKV